MGLAQPLPRGPHFPSPFLPFTPAQRQIGPPRGPVGQPAPLPFAAVADKAVPRAVPPPGGTHLSDPSPTSCPSRTRAAPQPRACFARSSSDSARSPPFKYHPKPRNPPKLSRAAAAASNSPESAAEIRTTAQPPLQRVQAS